MQRSLDCMLCFVRQAIDYAKLSTSDIELQQMIVGDSLKQISGMGWDEMPPYIAHIILDIARKHSGVDDPYEQVKQMSTRKAEHLYETWANGAATSRDPFETALRLAMAGNIIDFGVQHVVTDEQIEASIADSLNCPIFGSSISSIREETSKAGQILYLGDNAGETVFDRFLIEQIGPEKITYVVKGGPCINDATYEDARQAGITELVRVIDNGSRAPGTILRLCSEEFRRQFDSTDLVISKGQGNYESLTDAHQNFLFLLKAKCEPVANDIGCRLGDLVALVRKSPRKNECDIEELKAVITK